MEARPALTQPLLRAREAAGALRFNDPKQPRRSNLNAKLDGGRAGIPMGVLREGEDRRRACERAIGSAMFSNVRSEERNDKIGSPRPPCCRCYVRPNVWPRPPLFRRKRDQAGLLDPVAST